MTRAEAKLAVRRLQVAYPTRKISDDSWALWLDEFQALDTHHVAEALSDLIRSQKFFPAIAEFHERYRIVKEQANRERRGQRKTSVDCGWCADEGMVVYGFRTDTYRGVQAQFEELAPCPHCPTGKTRDAERFWQGRNADLVPLYPNGAEPLPYSENRRLLAGLTQREAIVREMSEQADTAIEELEF